MFPGTVIPLTPVGKLRGVRRHCRSPRARWHCRARARRVADSRSRHLHDLRISVTDKLQLPLHLLHAEEVFGPG